jgi:hypothetical protein
MLRLRVSSSSSSSSLVAKKNLTTFFTTAAATSFNTIRRYEYPAYGTHLSQEHARGNMIPKQYEQGFVRSRDANARSQTGNADIPTFDENTIYSPQAQVALDSQKYALFKNNRTYALDDVTPKQIVTACDLFEKMDTQKMWASLFKDYPSLKTPLDEETQKRILDTFQKGITNVQDDKAVGEFVKPIVLEFLENKYIHQPLWWRFSEKITEAMQAKADGTFSSRAAVCVLERFTKILYNASFETMPWASEDYVSPTHIDVCGSRQCTEAGMW